MKLRLAAIAAGLWLLTLPFAASAYEGYAAKNAHLRAGPARDYPVVAIVPAGTVLDVQGCLPDYSWCDVIVFGERGWIYAANIDYVYEGAPVPLIDYGPVIGITVFGFFLGDYWDRYYRHRPWYRDRDDWIRRPRPVQPPLPPRPRPPGAGLPPPHQMPPPHQPPPHQLPPPRPTPPHPVPPVRPQPPRGAPPAPPRREPPTHVPPPRSAEPGRPPTSSGDTPGPRRQPGP